MADPGPGSGNGRAPRRIVVGVDGSAGSRAAFRWAVGQAALTGAEVLAVHAIGPQDSYDWTILATNYGPAPLPVKFDRAEVRTFTEQSLTELVREVAGDEPAAPVTTRVVEGHATGELLAASEGADLLVVGRRGHGGFAGMRLGSVSRHCTEHASCGVVVIPADAT